MNMETAFRARIVAGLTEVAGRVYWVDRPQGKPLPDVTLQTISATRDQHMTGFQETQQVRVQVDVRADTYVLARQLREEAIETIAPRAVNDGIRFDRAWVLNFGEETERTSAGATVHRQRIDFLITYHAA